jgi:hypothetical protein
MRALILVVFLAGCAAQVHFPAREPDSSDGWKRWTEPPETVVVTWKRVAHYELQSVCNGGSILHAVPSVAPAQVNGCAFFTPDLKECVIYTKEHVFLETIGHEILHCFRGHWHK